MSAPFDNWLDWLPGKSLADGNELKHHASKLVRTLVKACGISFHTPRKRYIGAHDHRDRRIVVEWWGRHPNKLTITVGANGALWWSAGARGGWVAPGAELPQELLDAARALGLK